MRLTIIADDSAVYKDGNSILGIDLSHLPNNVHALQFANNTGWIEYKDGSPNEVIDKLPNWAETCIVLFDEAEAANNLPPNSNELLSLPEAKAQKIASISNTASMKIGAGIEFNGNIYDTDVVSRLNITERAMLIQDGDMIAWRTKANNTVNLNYTEFKALASAIVAHVENIYNTSWSYKDMVMNATTVEDVWNIVWE